MPKSATRSYVPAAVSCETCGSRLSPDATGCRNCGTLVHWQRLEQLAADATRVEEVNPSAAATIWRQCLDLLPPGSPHYHTILQRIGSLSPAATYGGASTARPPALPDAPPATRPEKSAPDAWPLAILKTGGSMLISIVCYSFLWMIWTEGHGTLWASLLFGAGFAGLILVHELGHVIAMWRYKLSAGPPIFIPFLGAIINMRQQPKNAWVEAVVGIGGPALGTVAALVAVALYAWLGLDPQSEYQHLLVTLAYFGVMINLFNLLPFPPLDGGRISAALSPWVWLVGVAGLGLLIYQEEIPLFFAALILFAGLPRIIDTLRSREARNDPYYKISAAKSVTMAVCFAGLAALLTGLVFWLPTPFFIHG